MSKQKRVIDLNSSIDTEFHNSIVRIKCGKTYFNARASRDEGRGSSCRLGPNRDSLAH